MQERVFRFSFVGVSFILAILFGYWVFGGKIFTLFASTDEYHLTLAFLIPIIFSPIIGFCLSSIIGLLREINFKNFDFLKPRNEIETRYYEILNNSFPNSGAFDTNHKPVWKSLYIYHQILLRTKYFNNEILKFTVRRMDLYWTHINISFSMLLGIIIGLGLTIYLPGINYRAFSFFKFLLLCCPFIYFLFAFFQGKQVLKEVNDIEKQHMVFFDETTP